MHSELKGKYGRISLLLLLTQDLGYLDVHHRDIDSSSLHTEPNHGTWCSPDQTSTLSCFTARPRTSR
jgi:hypothetical protein